MLVTDRAILAGLTKREKLGVWCHRAVPLMACATVACFLCARQAGGPASPPFLWVIFPAAFVIRLLLESAVGVVRRGKPQAFPSCPLSAELAAISRGLRSRAVTDRGWDEDLYRWTPATADSGPAKLRAGRPYTIRHAPRRGGETEIDRVQTNRIVMSWWIGVVDKSPGLCIPLHVLRRLEPETITAVLAVRHSFGAGLGYNMIGSRIGCGVVASVLALLAVLAWMYAVFDLALAAGACVLIIHAALLVAVAHVAWAILRWLIGGSHVLAFRAWRDACPLEERTPLRFALALAEFNMAATDVPGLFLSAHATRLRGWRARRWLKRIAPEGADAILEEVARRMTARMREEAGATG